MFEVEVKARLKNRKMVMKKLRDLGCVFKKEVHQVDEIFTPSSIPFPPPIGSPVLRIRKENNIFILTLKINQSSRQDCIEHELQIGNAKEMRAIIKLLQFKLDVIVEKRRIKTKYKDTEVVLDRVKHLGEFIEAEKIVTHSNPEKRKKVQGQLFEFLETLGISKKDRVIDGKYDIMLEEKLNRE